MIKLLRRWVLICCLMAVFPGYAALDLELTQGVSTAIPIGVASFKNEVDSKASDEVPISRIIEQDLQSSGQFRLVSSGSLQAGAVDGSLDLAQWKKQGARDVLMGVVHRQGFGHYRVDFQLMSTYAGASTSHTSQSAVLLKQSVSVQSGDLRQIAHHISDLVYEKLLSVRGVFSTKIAYVLVQRQQSVTQYALEVADADGYNAHTLLRSYQPIMSPAWSPDGKHIAYVSFENNRSAIYLQDLISGKRKRISDLPGINGAPRFSPDGKSLALVLTKTGNPKIYRLDLASAQVTQLTRGYSIDTEPAWAVDGKSILYTSNRGGSPQVYQCDLATGQSKRLTFNGDYNARASFLPDDSAIIMMHRGTGLFGIANQDLTSGQVQILTQTGADESPSVAPNGKMVIYATRYAGKSVLGMVSTDGRVKIRLPARDGDVQEPAWSPFLT